MRVLTTGWSTKSQVCGCVAFSRPNCVKNCPTFAWRPPGSEVVVRNISSNSVSDPPSGLMAKTMCDSAVK